MGPATVSSFVGLLRLLAQFVSFLVQLVGLSSQAFVLGVCGVVVVALVVVETQADSPVNYVHWIVVSGERLSSWHYVRE